MNVSSIDGWMDERSAKWLGFHFKNQLQPLHQYALLLSSNVKNIPFYDQLYRKLGIFSLLLTAVIILAMMSEMNQRKERRKKNKSMNIIFISIVIGHR